MTSVSTYKYNMKQISIVPELICSICADLLYKPVLTPCIHIFCKQCIEQWFKNEGKSCPICRYSLSIENIICITKYNGLEKINQVQDQFIKDEQNQIESDIL